MDSRRFLVTGGSQGIGAAVVDQARRAGHQVVFTGRSERLLEEVARRSGARAVRADVAVAGDNDRTLDVCRKCRGVWFDHHELSAIWTLQLDHAVAARRAGGSAAGDASLVLLDSLIWAPDLLFLSAHGAVHALGAAGEAIANGPEAIGGAVEVVGEAAASVFELIVDIVGGIFS